MLSGASTPSWSVGLQYAHFGLEVCLIDYKGDLVTERFDAVPLNGDAEAVHDVRNGFDRHTILRAWVRHWTHWGGRSAVLRSDEIPNADMSVGRYKEEYEYAARLTAVINYCYSLPGGNLSSADLLSFLHLLSSAL